METMRTSIETTARGWLMAQLEGIEHRLQNEVEVPPATFAGGDFLDVAQSVEQQELARLDAGGRDAVDGTDPQRRGLPHGGGRHPGEARRSADGAGEAGAPADPRWQDGLRLS